MKDNLDVPYIRPFAPHSGEPLRWAEMCEYKVDTIFGTDVAVMSHKQATRPHCTALHRVQW
jgi:hypothetical protein